MADLVIRNGTIVDGTGRDRFVADVSIQGGIITAVGSVDERGDREIDASGQLVTPGFVDIHTHYDGQATWDSMLAPSSWHGVTSVVFGNCGVGFAPVRPDAHDLLISLMEGVEDIPGTALHEGLAWDWETFPQFMDALERRPHAVDMGVYVPHAPLRAYVMGERGANHEEDPTAEEIGEMARLTREGLDAGALGFATSRQIAHRARDGAKIGTLTASQEELLGIAQALRAAGKGVIQFNSNLRDEAEFDLLRLVAEAAGRPFSLLLFQEPSDPDRWRRTLDWLEDGTSAGLSMSGQVAGRAIGTMYGLDATMNPFANTPSYQALAGRDLESRVAELGRPDVRARILAEYPEHKESYRPHIVWRLERVFPLSDPPNYEPDRSDSFGARGERLGVDPMGLLYDHLLEDGGRGLAYVPTANFIEFNLEACREMILSDRTILGLSDGGAHVGILCDASLTTSYLTHWTRDRKQGERLSLEFVVQKLTSGTARYVGWFDRGVIAPGYRADVNVIDYDRLTLRRPYLSWDLPAGGRRFLQKAEGYRYTICGGEITFADGEATGALPGRLVRGARPAPVA